MDTNAQRPVEILIPSGTVVGYTYANRGGAISGTVRLLGDAYVMATRQEDGAWKYGTDKRTYFCAGGLAEVVSR